MASPHFSALSNSELVNHARKALDDLRAAADAAYDHKSKGLTSEEVRLVDFLDQTSDRSASPIRRSLMAKMAAVVKTDVLGLADPVAPRFKVDPQERLDAQRELEDIRASRGKDFDLEVVDNPMTDPTAITKLAVATRQEFIAAGVLQSAAVGNREQFAAELKEARYLVGEASLALLEMAERTDTAIKADPSWLRSSPQEATERQDFRREFQNGSRVDADTEWSLDDVSYLLDGADAFFAQELPRLGYDRFGNETEMSVLAHQQNPGMTRLMAAFARAENTGAILVLPSGDNRIQQLGTPLSFAVVESIDANSNSIVLRRGLSVASKGVMLDETCAVTFDQLDNDETEYSLDGASTSRLDHRELTIDTSEITKSAARAGSVSLSTYQNFNQGIFRKTMNGVSVESPVTAIAPRQAFIEVGAQFVTGLSQSIEVSAARGVAIQEF